MVDHKFCQVCLKSRGSYYQSRARIRFRVLFGGALNIIFGTQEGSLLLTTLQYACVSLHQPWINGPSSTPSPEHYVVGPKSSRTTPDSRTASTPSRRTSILVLRNPGVKGLGPLKEFRGL